MIQWARFASKASKLGSKAKKTGFAFGSRIKAANLAAIKKSKEATNLYFQNKKKARISSAVDLGIGATGGYLISQSLNKNKKDTI